MEVAEIMDIEEKAKKSTYEIKQKSEPDKFLSQKDRKGHIKTFEQKYN